jgi:RNA ligase (TIGR02306 family)
MSTLEVKLVRIYAIEPHPAADRLQIAVLDGPSGFRSVVGLGQFQSGDLCLYLPPDSMLSDRVLSVMENEKIKVERRLRAIKIRGIVSEGLCLKPATLLPDNMIKEGNDVTEYLQIQKYQPPPPPGQFCKASKGINLNYENPNFLRFTDIERIEKNSWVIKDGEPVVATIKFHGMNAKFGIVRKSHTPLKILIARIYKYFF